MRNARQSWLERWGTFLFRTRDALFPAVILACLVLSQPQFPGGDRRADLWLDLLGVVVALLGQLLRILVIGYRYIARGGKNRRVHAEDLVTGGIFALSRNPLYVGNMLVLLGLFLIWNSPLLYLVGIPFVLLGYRGIVAAEEAFLRGRFGEEYEAYVATTNRWIPDPRKAPGALAGIPFNWKRVLLREYGSWTAWVGTACALIIVESLRWEPYDAQPRFMNLLLGIIAIDVVLWAIVRWLKLSRRITAD